MRENHLFPALDAGSSRVFNVCARTAELIREAGPDANEDDLDLLFRTRELNRIVLIKEARTDRNSAPFQFGHPVGTKLYLPYNPDRIFDGGKSAFLDDPRIEEILLDHVGLDRTRNADDVKRDMGLVQLLDEVPSLDPFLLKDKLDTEGIKANELYFQIEESEAKAIRSYFAEKMRPIISFAFEGSEDLQKGRTNALVGKLWNTKDIDSLRPIVEAFNLPEREASSIFAAWKGILYYDYEYKQAIPYWKEHAQWMQQNAEPVDFAGPERRELLDSLIDDVWRRYEEARRDLTELFLDYEEAYDILFVRRKNATQFVEFMRNAVKAYWVLGSKMSAINHAATVWDMLTRQSFNRRLKYDQLYVLFDLQREILDKT